MRVRGQELSMINDSVENLDSRVPRKLALNHFLLPSRSTSIQNQPIASFDYVYWSKVECKSFTRRPFTYAAV